jgi:ribosomal protein L33
MSSGSRTRTIKTQLQCPECQSVQTIHRKAGKTKEKFHIKHMYCPFCKEITGHIEVKDDIFLPEWLRESSGSE